MDAARDFMADQAARLVLRPQITTDANVRTERPSKPRSRQTWTKRSKTTRLRSPFTFCTGSLPVR